MDDVDRTAVFRAESPSGEEGFVKIVPRPPGKDPDELRTERFMAEVANLLSLDHPGLVNVLDAGVEDDCYYLVLERIGGRSLSDVIRRREVHFGSLLAVALEVGDTLSQLHEVDVVVRDLEPSNVVIDHTGRAVIAGVALSALTRLSAGDFLGVPGFVAPELLLGLSPSHLSDQYSFGRLLLCLAGVVPNIEVDRTQPVRPQLEASFAIMWSSYPTTDDFAALRSVLERLTMRRAAERYPSMAQAVEELVQLALRFAPAPDGADETVPVEVGIDTNPEPITMGDSEAVAAGPRTRSIVVASDGVLSIEVEDIDGLSGPVEIDGPADYLDQLRMTAERHLSKHGSSPLLSPVALPESAASATEPTTVPAQITATPEGFDDDDELAETWVPDPKGLDPLRPDTDPREAFDRSETLTTRPPAKKVSFTVSRDTLAPARPRDATRAERPRPRPLPRPKREPQPTRRRFNWGAFATAAVLSFGAIWIARTVVVSVDGATLKPDILPVAASARPRASFSGEAPLTSDATRRARAHFARARAALAQNRIEDAEEELVACIEIADLPECHRTFAALLSLTQDPAAGAHLVRYLQSPDADLSLRNRLR